MQLNSLKLINFRNYDNLYIDFNKKVEKSTFLYFFTNIIINIKNI